jgi:hypothetical protein
MLEDVVIYRKLQRDVTVLLPQCKARFSKQLCMEIFATFFLAARY